MSRDEQATEPSETARELAGRLMDYAHLEQRGYIPEDVEAARLIDAALNEARADQANARAEKAEQLMEGATYLRKLVESREGEWRDQAHEYAQQRDRYARELGEANARAEQAERERDEARQAHDAERRALYDANAERKNAEAERDELRVTLAKVRELADEWLDEPDPIGGDNVVFAIRANGRSLRAALGDTDTGRQG